MPGQIHRLGDENDAGAAITSTKQTLVSVGGQPIATDGDPIAGHGIGEHASPVTANGNTLVTIGGIPINRQGDADSCGHVRDTGATQVIIG